MPHTKHGRSSVAKALHTLKKGSTPNNLAKAALTKKTSDVQISEAQRSQPGSVQREQGQLYNSSKQAMYKRKQRLKREARALAQKCESMGFKMAELFPCLYPDMVLLSKEENTKLLSKAQDLDLTSTLLGIKEAGLSYKQYNKLASSLQVQDIQLPKCLPRFGAELARHLTALYGISSMGSEMTGWRLDFTVLLHELCSFYEVESWTEERYFSALG